MTDREKQFLLYALIITGGIVMWNRRSVSGAISNATSTVKAVTNTAVAITLQGAGENEKKYAPIIADAEKKYGIPAGMLHRLIKAESAFRSDVISGAKKSGVGALGIAQFMPATSAQLGVNPLDPVASIYAAAKYLTQIRSYLKSKKVPDDWKFILAGYNWGMGAVAKAYEAHGSNLLAYAPVETKNYVGKIVV